MTVKESMEKAIRESKGKGKESKRQGIKGIKRLELATTPLIPLIP
jgi:hypothetical protein